MEEFYRLKPLVPCSDDDAVRVGDVSASSAAALIPTELFHGPVANNYLQLEASEPDVTGSDMSDGMIKTQIASHPLYPNLVSAFIECQKVGAPPELASLLEEIGRGNNPVIGRQHIGDDPELDEFMESYCEVLHRYKEELSRPLKEATSFLSDITSQLSNLCKGNLTKSSDNRSDEAAGTSEEELSCGEVEALEINESCSSGAGDQELKEMLLRKYSGYLSSLRRDFLKKRKKVKLPKDAKTALLEWWNTHYRWPYPTEEEKMKLSEITGLGHKQINNWFINQRKRHWKPSEDMRFAVMEDVTAGGLGGVGGGPIYFDSGGAAHQCGGDISKFPSPF